MMNSKFFTYLASILLIGVYLLSYVGFSVHRCSCEGSVQVSVLIGNPDCEHLHAHINLSENEFHHCEESHQDGCCTTEIFVLTTDQCGTDSNNFFSYLSANSLPVAISYGEPSLDSLSVGQKYFRDNSEMLLSHRHCRSLLSVWRL